MIDSIKGIINSKTPGYVIIDLHGLRLKVFITVATYENLPEKGQVAELLTYFNVREDLMELFGFGNEDERKMFLLLNTISGIGPRTALNILSGTQLTEFRKNIIAGDVQSLTVIPGIGNKTAKRIIVELKEKFVEDKEDNLDYLSTSENGVMGDVVIALMSLGYKRNNINLALRTLESEGELNGNIELIIKKALKKL